MLQRVLLALTQAGHSREDAYKIVQKNAMDVWQNGTTFLDQLKTDSTILSALSADELDQMFESNNDVTGHVKEIFARVFAAQKT